MSANAIQRGMGKHNTYCSPSKPSFKKNPIEQFYNATEFRAPSDPFTPEFNEISMTPIYDDTQYAKSNMNQRALFDQDKASSNLYDEVPYPARRLNFDLTSAKKSTGKQTV